MPGFPDTLAGLTPGRLHSSSDAGSAAQAPRRRLWQRSRCDRHHVAVPTQAELQRLLHAITARIARALEKQGLLLRDDRTLLPFEAA